MSDKHLFGRDGDEVLEFDWYTVFEHQIDAWGVNDTERLTADELAAIRGGLDERTPSGERGLAIEEWTSSPLSRYLPGVGITIERAMEHLADNDITEYAWDAIDRKEEAVTTDPEVVAAFTEALRVLGVVLDREVTFHMADTLVTTHWVTFGDDGRPRFDGELIFPDREERADG